MPRAKEAVQAASTSAQAQQELVSEGLENFELPRSLVTKIARSALPDNTKLQKDVVTSYVKASTVFINYLAATAHDVASSKQHKSVSASDILKALEMMEMGDMVDTLQKELQIYRDLQKADKHRRSSNAASTKGKGKDVESISASASSAKGRGKEKASAQAIPPITISRSAIQRAPPEAEDAGSDEDMPDADDDDDDVPDEDGEGEEEDDAEGSEPEDVMVVEDDELREGVALQE
ncbi:hypothetical protein CERSUDRAFT_127304 [Gelatoporia subvermispora B]|uniref:DNA polymerase epsilon subunit D n=1 Tax=Ceriporiopsis subvermispora (strain B) TaxID=914234 RepID=M2QHL9_CERS8|nr:hypothetical protein CERSUDRAFT_127304 [Gelatoporia subvermispora B]